MSVHCFNSSRFQSLRTRWLAATAFAIALPPSGAVQAQAVPDNLVGVCSGVSLPPSVVTGILGPVVEGVAEPTQDRVNRILGLLGGLPVIPTLTIDVEGLLANAAAGQPITLQAIAADGTLVGPTDGCDAQADSFNLTNPAGVSLGGNVITGLGDPTRLAVAGEINSVAIGNDASTAASAVGSIALGRGATVAAGAGNSVALGAGSVAARGATAGSVGEVSVGALGAERQITNVAAGTAPTDAANVGQVQVVTDGLAALNGRAIQYDDANRATATLGGADGTVLANVAAGAVAAGSRDAVNGGQLAATEGRVAANAAGLVDVAATAVRYDSAAQTSVTLGAAGAAPVTLGNVAAGVATTDAVNVGQLQAVAGDVATLNDQAIIYDDVNRAIATLSGADGTVLANVAAGAVAAGSRDAVNGGQLFTTNQSIDALRSQITAGGAGPVRYVDDQTGVSSAGLTNTVTITGAYGAPVTITNVAAGSLAPGSNEAVNGTQLAATNTQVAANGDRITVNTGQITSTQAQLATTNTQVAANGNRITANTAQIVQTNSQVAANTTSISNLDATSVRYDGPMRQSVTLNSGGGAVTLRNLAAGVAAGDAVNLGQLNAGLAGTLASAQAYTDQRIGALSFDLASLRDDADAGSAGALAVAGLPQTITPGRGMMAVGAGTFRGESAFAFGGSFAAPSGSVIFKAGATFNTRGDLGANGGVGISF